MSEINYAISAACNELVKAQQKFGDFASPHEGYAVILEEVDELWAEVKRNDRSAMRAEAIQVAAMVLRFLVDCVPESANA